MYFLYILKSQDRNYIYVGTTNNLKKRLQQHTDGLVRSTKAWRPFILVHIEIYKTLAEARQREWFLKCTPQGGKEKHRIVRSFLDSRDVPRRSRDGGRRPSRHKVA